MDENTTQPVNPTDDQVTTPINGEETTQSEEETPATDSNTATDQEANENAPVANSDEAAN
ncbi:hypothetical protein A2810_02450 [candidate division Kazan bacterium RIFCSPHIGHO2_01_FULL_49_10]|uniref:Uncharacterized protein n=1 Tax=candidate division Kazan bacterium RIFCSPLOWO2_01_FULL_48_13 TaxID=1798539 RepID=A0A1F4PP17_UNCK3|nr:MAG: hypothetical protein A2810_02450 [candidate division Kazan bacterium RIFCSPHIGHO2_01_FULL_49_10]OGB85375.1 MAG: hypothetical protein A2994_01985 [candidate division Kazan bacterium RIFCSPLOWO2_01_FULL_48_13]